MDALEAIISGLVLIRPPIIPPQLFNRLYFCLADETQSSRRIYAENLRQQNGE